MYSPHPLEYWLLLPKTLSIVLFLVLGIRIFKLKRNYLLNQLIATAMWAWALFILNDSIQYIMAPISPTTLILANYLRRIQLTAAIATGFLFYLSYQVIKKGKKDLISRAFWIELSVLIIVDIIMVVQEQIYVVDANDIRVPIELLGTDLYGVKARPVVNLAIALTSIVPLGIILYTVAGLIIIIKREIAPDNPQRKKMVFLVWGIALLPVGMIYFIFHTMTGWYDFLSISIGYIPWTLSPIFILQSQRS